MAITKSAKKALRQSERKRIRNLQQKMKMKNLLKEVRILITQAPAKGGEKSLDSSIWEKKSEEAKKLLSQTYQVLDKAAKTGLIKKGAAARKKSRLTKLLAKYSK